MSKKAISEEIHKFNPELDLGNMEATTLFGFAQTHWLSGKKDVELTGGYYDENAIGELKKSIKACTEAESLDISKIALKSLFTSDVLSEVLKLSQLKTLKLFCVNQENFKAITNFIENNNHIKDITFIAFDDTHAGFIIGALQESLNKKAIIIENLTITNQKGDILAFEEYNNIAQVLIESSIQSKKLLFSKQAQFMQKDMAFSITPKDKVEKNDAYKQYAIDRNIPSQKIQFVPIRQEEQKEQTLVQSIKPQCLNELQEDPLLYSVKPLGEKTPDEV